MAMVLVTVAVNWDCRVRLHRLCTTQKASHLNCCHSQWEASSRYFFCSFCFLSSWHCSYAHGAVLRRVSHFTKALSIVLHVLPFFRLNHLHLSSSFLIHYSASSHLPLSPSSEFFHFSYCIFNLRISIWFFKNNFYPFINVFYLMRHDHHIFLFKAWFPLVLWISL